MEVSILVNRGKAKNRINLGSSICINRLGTSIELLRYLIEIIVNFVKLSSIFTTHIDKKEDDVLLLGAFICMAHGLNTSIIAYCVEIEKLNNFHCY
ncbi:EAL domain-containing protein [Psychromonas antarctica]|uniref:EAL domain-containing protein n=1 Tax=Psychromonas antarctica TaxID=67573 RepID=UPI001EE88BFA|nr:EAL domain-containing protein [Psychromonas antarctica]MCG6201918.1 EAL domain-containing protein [Psychromonas antarctica]